MALLVGERGRGEGVGQEGRREKEHIEKNLGNTDEKNNTELELWLYYLFLPFFGGSVNKNKPCLKTLRREDRF